MTDDYLPSPEQMRALTPYIDEVMAGREPPTLDRFAAAMMRGGGRPIPTPQPHTGIISLDDLVKQHPTQKEPLVEGLLRCGQTMNIIAATKMGKSFLAAGLAFAVANGRDFLGMKCHRGRVLLIDYELQHSDLSSRLKRIANDMRVSLDNIDVLPLRGSPKSIIEIVQASKEFQGRYALIILDTLSRSLPAGTSENENGAMVAVYSQIDAVAETTGAAVVIIHHSTKGSQADKSLVDIGSGASAIARSVDTHLIVRPHAEDDHAILEAICRSFKSPEPITIRWEYPLWHRSTLGPKMKEQQTPRERKQIASDEAALAEVLDLIGKCKKLQRSAIVSQCSFGSSKLARILKIAEQSGLIKPKTCTPAGTVKPITFYILANKENQS
jgi:hypothetical protein